MRFWADENLHNRILQGLLKRLPDLDIERVQDTEFSGIDDPTLLEEGAKRGIILITHDIRTVTKFAYERVKAGLTMPGVIEVAHDISINQAIDDLALLIGAGTPEDFENQVQYIPLR